MRLSHLFPSDLLGGQANIVDERLTAAIAEARARWPGVELAPEVLVGWITPRLPAAVTDLAAALAALRISDLYLACACAAGNARALAAFDRAFLASETRVSDDVKQRLRQKLFVSDPAGPPPRITGYAGRGELAAWVRAATARMAIDEARATREVPADEALMEAIGIDPASSPELAHRKQEVRALLQAAFRGAVGQLADRERTMLLQYYIDGVGLAALGKLFSLAPSNVSRTLVKARVRLVAQVRRALLRDGKLDGEPLEALVELVHSQLRLTGALREPHPTAT